MDRRLKMKRCPLLEDTNKTELAKRLEIANKLLIEKDNIIDGLMKENKTYREHYWKCREEQDKDYWGR